LFNRILVAVDGSDPSIQALIHAAELSLKMGSELTVISVLNKLELPFSAEYGLWAQDSREELIRRVLEKLNLSITEIKESHPELKIEARIEEGKPAKKIVEIAEAENYDLIIVGRRGYGMVEGWVLGSVSNEVVNTSTKPVLVVK
jgi:nucleotide-binding universal stress UspA family protein